MYHVDIGMRVMTSVIKRIDSMRFVQAMLNTIGLYNFGLYNFGLYNFGLHNNLFPRTSNKTIIIFLNKYF
jgi:hypothetical protein